MDCIATLKELSVARIEKRLDFNGSVEDIVPTLSGIRGFGQWSADYVALRLRRTRCVPFGRYRTSSNFIEAWRADHGICTCTNSKLGGPGGDTQRCTFGASEGDSLRRKCGLRSILNV